MAVKAGLQGMHLVGVHEDPLWDSTQYGFDASTCQKLPDLRDWISRRRPIAWAKQKLVEARGLPTIYTYEQAIPRLMPDRIDGIAAYPMVTHAWDNTPRSGSRGLVLHESTPELFRQVLRRALDLVHDSAPDERIVFLKSWNEWAEGNHLEPDLKFGRGYLEVIGDEVLDSPG
jgi:hypothetical protein